MKGQLIQHSETSPPEFIPALNHAWRGNSVYYFRMIIPRELKWAGISFEVVGKKMRFEIKFSLRVADYRSAASKAALHAAVRKREAFTRGRCG